VLQKPVQKYEDNPQRTPCVYLQVLFNRQPPALKRQEVVDLLVVDLHVGHPDEELAVVRLLRSPKPNKLIHRSNSHHTNRPNMGIIVLFGEMLIEQSTHLTHGVEDVADGARDDAGVGVGAVHGERLAAAGLPVGEGGGVEAVDDGTDEIPDDRAVDPLVGGCPVEYVVCGGNRQIINPRKEPRARGVSDREREQGGRERENGGGGGEIRTEDERCAGSGAGGAVDEGDAGVVDAPLAVAASAGAARGGVCGGRVGRAEADGDGDLLHGCGGGEDNGRRMLRSLPSWGWGFQISV
jgi:hypothetical protein